MAVSGPQAKAARALIQWPRTHVAKLAEISVDALAAFERGFADPGDDAVARIVRVLEDGGAVFFDETAELGAGVRLKFTRKEVRSINRLENEGGPVGDDDV